MKTILLVFHDADMSGATMALVDLLQSWIKNNEFKFLCILPKRNGQVNSKLEELGVKYYCLRYWQVYRNGNENAFDNFELKIKFIVGLINTLFFCLFFLRKQDIDVVYSNTSSIYNGALISKILNTKHVWHVREYISKERAIVSLIPERKHYDVILNNSDYIVTISDALNNFYEMQMGKHEKFIKLYDDVSSSKIYLDDWNSKKYRILFVGNIIEGKGQLVAIKALNRLIKENELYHLSFVGPLIDHEYYNVMKQYVEKENISQYVSFCGKHSCLDEFRLEHGIAIVASKNEPFGRVTIEAMQSGQVVIGADAGCTKELIVNEENGFTFNPDGDFDLYLKIRNLNKCEDIEKIRCNAYEFSKVFTSGKCADSILEIFLERKM